MRSHGLRQLVDDKSVASCQQTCCKMIVKTCYPQACCKLFQQVVTSLQMTSCNKPDFYKLPATLMKLTSLLQFVDKLQQVGKIDNLQQVCDVFWLCTVQYCIVLYCTVLHCIVLYCIVLYCTVLYCIVLYCTVLYCIDSRFDIFGSVYFLFFLRYSSQFWEVLHIVLLLRKFSVFGGYLISFG